MIGQSPTESALPTRINAAADSRALVLAGAGAKGAFQARLWWQLERRGLRCDHVFGVSAGSLNGAKISCGQTYPLMKVWERTRKENVVSGGLSLWRLASLLTKAKNSLFDTRPLYELLFSEYHPADTRIPFTMGWTNYDEGGRYESLTVAPNTAYTDADRDAIISRIMASSSVPITHPPVEVDGEDCFDGGVRNITPLADAMSGDFDQIIVILAEQLRRADRDVDLSDIRTVGTETLAVLLNEIINNDVKMATTINHAVQQWERLVDWMIDTGRIEGRDELPGTGYLSHRNGRRLYDTDIILLQPDASLGSGEDFSEAAVGKRFRAADRLNAEIELV